MGWGFFKAFYLRKVPDQTLRGRNKNAQLFGGLSMILSSQDMWPSHILGQLAVSYLRYLVAEGTRYTPQAAYLEKEGRRMPSWTSLATLDYP